MQLREIVLFSQPGFRNVAMTYCFVRLVGEGFADILTNASLRS
jgi:hypothetical protein